MRKKIIILSVIVLLVLSTIFTLIVHKNKVESLEREEYISNIKQSYNKYVKIKNNTNLYDSNKNVIGKISKDVKISLKDKDITDEKDDYFELELFDGHYVYFADVDKVDSLDEKDTYYKNYIVFNENCVTKNKTSFYDENFNLLYQVNGGYDLPIYIKEDDYFGVEFNNEIVYLKKDDVTLKSSNNTEEKNAKSIPVLLYHFFHTHNNYEDMKTVISIRTDKFESELKYLTDNNFMTLKMKDLELYVNGKVQIKENSVVLTIDDGDSTVFKLAYPIIEKYKVNATLFAITSWDPNILEKQTDYVEIHSHTNNMHITGRCSGGQGGLFKCVDYNEGLDDLNKSREILNGTTYLAYPFGEYTNHSIKSLKDAGYTMAFTTNYGNVKVGDDPYLLPRMYVYNEYSLDTFKRMVN